jgi:galactan endo-1,6-beta-galactosidase
MVGGALAVGCQPPDGEGDELDATSSALKVQLDPGQDWGTWEGWGTSLAWWGKAFGDRDDLADVFFTRNWVEVEGQMLPGLGLNIVRYNAGANSAKPAGGTSIVNSPNIPPATQVDGYWLDWNSDDPASASWNWLADANQRSMLWKARDRGVNVFDLFSNSPMWWMLYNHNPSGAPDGGENLQSWNYRKHAVYLATIAKFAQDNWGFRFSTVEAFNEPSASWWKADGRQEGCHIGASVQQPVIQALREELNRRNLGSVGIAASDESFYDQARATWSAFPAATRAEVGRVNVHGYQYEGGRRDLLHQDVSAAGKRLWNSEYGDPDGTGLKLARNLNLDMQYLHPTAWVYWQAVDGVGWGLIQGDRGKATLGAVNIKYYVLAQYARHIRPGMKILSSGDPNTVAAYDPAAHRLVLVTANLGAATQVVYDLSKFGVVGTDGATLNRWVTQIAGAEHYGNHSDIRLQGKTFSVSFDKSSVQTFEIDNVSL